MNEVFEQVSAAVVPEEVLALARGALQIPSISGEERPVAEYFAAHMAEAGLDARLQPVPATALMGESVNAIGELAGSGGGASLLFNGHIDHNPVSAGWSLDPFGGEVRDGWLYGFVHMKAADACYIAAINAVRRAGISLRGDVRVALVSGELRGGAGTRAALAGGLRADHFVLGEPTELELGVAHTASIVVRLHVLGRTKHFSTIEVGETRGINAVEKAAKVIAAIAPSHRAMAGRGEGGWMSFTPAAGFEGLPQINLGPVRAGIGAEHNMTRPALFPDRCTLSVDFRIVPGMTKATIAEDLAFLLARLREDDPDIDWQVEFMPDSFPLPFRGDRSSLITRTVAAMHAGVTGAAAAASKLLKFAASDASWLADAGIEGIIYGPAGRYLSRPDERCEVSDLVTATKVYACTIAAICGTVT